MKPPPQRNTHPGSIPPAAKAPLPSRSGATARLWLGNILMLTGFLGLLVIKVISNAGLGIAMSVLLSCVVGLAATAVGLFGRHLAMTGRKQHAVIVARAGLSDKRAPVVYLRSFVDDGKVAQAHVVEGFIQLSTEEEQFAKVLRRIGPFIAIGDPREKLPMLGADRVYVGNGEWKKDVEDLLAKARLVVLRLSPSEGLLWEVQQVVSRVEPNRLLLFLPRNYKYDFIKKLAERWLPKPLPALPRQRTTIGTLRGILRFRADWTPEFIPSRFSCIRLSLRSPISPHLQLMLRPVFKQLGVPWSKPRLGTLPVLFIIVLLWTILRMHR